MRRLLRDQSGIALPAALGVLVVVGTLSTATFAVSSRLNDSSTASRDAKRALCGRGRRARGGHVPHERDRAAERRPSASRRRPSIPATGTDPETGSTPAAGECAGVEDDLGNGSSYTYYVTPALGDGDVCAGLDVHLNDPNGEVTVTQRCVTSIGEANGERRRIQARVASYIGDSALPCRRDPRDQRDQGEEHRDRERCARLERPDRARQQQRRERRHPARHSVDPTAHSRTGQHGRREPTRHVPLRGGGRVRARTGRHGQHRHGERQQPDRHRPGHRQQRHLHQHRRTPRGRCRSATTARSRWAEVPTTSARSRSATTPTSPSLPARRSASSSTRRTA